MEKYLDDIEEGVEGKTTLLQAMIEEINKSVPHERIGIIDDSEELSPPKNGFIYNLIDDDMRAFYKSDALKYKPNRILINEVRTDEQILYSIKLSRTIGGEIFTIHGNSVVSPFSSGDTTEKVGGALKKVIDVIVYLTKNWKKNSYRIEEIVESKNFKDFKDETLIPYKEKCLITYSNLL